MYLDDVYKPSPQWSEDETLTPKLYFTEMMTDESEILMQC